jgi:hypothetical protein
MRRVIKGRSAGWLLLAPLLVASFLLWSGSAAADPASDLTAAESRAAVAEADVAGARQQLNTARADYAAASRKAGPVAEAAREARADARDLRDRLVDRQRRARAEIALSEASQREEEEDRDEEASNGIGFGLAALIAAAIALAWGWFRASAAVAALVRMQLGQAIALCLGGGFLLIVVGAALMGGSGFAAVLGALVMCLGFVLPVALLLARHSAEIQRGRAKPISGRDRLPSWVPRAAAVLLLLLGLGGLIGAITAEEPEAPVVSTQMREDAEPLQSGPGAARLEEAKVEAAAARRKAAGPLAGQAATRVELRAATRTLRRGKALLVDAEADERRFERRLVALVQREEREAARVEREVEAQAEREAEEAEEAEEFEFFEEEESSSGCDPNYSGCVPAYPPDVDCAEVGESVSSYGTDPHGLDADADGVGCE